MRVGLCCVHVLGSIGIMWALMDARYSLVLTGHDGDSMGLSGSLMGAWYSERRAHDIANGLWRLLLDMFVSVVFVLFHVVSFWFLLYRCVSMCNHCCNCVGCTVGTDED